MLQHTRQRSFVYIAPILIQSIIHYLVNRDTIKIIPAILTISSSERNREHVPVADRNRKEPNRLSVSSFRTNKLYVQ